MFDCEPGARVLAISFKYTFGFSAFFLSLNTMILTRKRYIYVCKSSGELKESDFMLVTDEIDTDDLKEYGSILFIYFLKKRVLGII